MQFSKALSNNNLEIYYQNVRWLRSKTIEFYRNLCTNSYDLIILTENWLNDRVLDFEVFDNRFIVWRRDRNYNLAYQKSGGGVLTASRNSLKITPQPNYNSSADLLTSG